MNPDHPDFIGSGGYIETHGYLTPSPFHPGGVAAHIGTKPTRTPVTGRVSKALKGVPGHTCNICVPPKTFARNEHLKRHQLLHHKPAFVCEVPACDWEFHRKDLLERHQQRHEEASKRAGGHDSMSAPSKTESARPKSKVAPSLANVHGGDFGRPVSPSTATNPLIGQPQSPPAHLSHFPSPLGMNAPSLAQSVAMKNWTGDELRGSIREILEEKHGIENTIDEIVSLFTKFDDREAGDMKTGKDFLMRRFLIQWPRKARHRSDRSGGTDSCPPIDNAPTKDPFAGNDDSSQSLPAPTHAPNFVVSARQHPAEVCNPSTSGLASDRDVLAHRWDHVGDRAALHKPVMDSATPHAEGRNDRLVDQSGLQANYEKHTEGSNGGCERDSGSESPGESQTSSGMRSKSCDSSSNVSDDAGFSELPISILGDQAESVIKKISGFFERLIDIRLQPGIARQCHDGQRSHAEGTGTSQMQASPSLGFNSRTSVNWEGKKRLNDSGKDKDEENSGDEDEGGKLPHKRQKSEALRPRLACPYIKRHPAEFSGWRTCVGPGFDGINRVKEHLKRRHLKQHVCRRCGLQFRTSRLLDEHSRSEVSCRLQHVEPELGYMDQLQWEDIHEKTRGHGIDANVRWRDIYMILFPDTDVSSAPGPFFDATETSADLKGMIDPEEYGSYFRENLPKRILVKLNEEFNIMAEHAKQRLLEIIQEESAETLKEFLRCKGVNAPLPRITTSTLAPLEAIPAPEKAWDTSLLDNIDIFSHQSPVVDLEDCYRLSNYLVPPECSLGQADSAYGSNVVDKGSIPEGGLADTGSDIE